MNKVLNDDLLYEIYSVVEEIPKKCGNLYTKY